MDEYAQLKRFHRDFWLQVYIYAFIYVDPNTMPVEGYFPATKTFVENHNEMWTPGPFPKHWLVFSYIRSEDYELDLNLDETEMKKKSDHTSNNKVKLFQVNIVVLEEE